MLFKWIVWVSLTKMVLTWFVLFYQQDAVRPYITEQTEVHPDIMGDGRETVQFFQDSFGFTGHWDWLLLSGRDFHSTIEQKFASWITLNLPVVDSFELCHTEWCEGCHYSQCWDGSPLWRRTGWSMSPQGGSSPLPTSLSSTPARRRTRGFQLLWTEAGVGVWGEHGAANQRFKLAPIGLDSQ